MTTRLNLLGEDSIVLFDTAHASGDDFIFRNLMTAVSFWGSKWTLAEAVNFLVQSGDLVRNVSKGTTRQWRAVNQFEEKHSFKFFIQWTDNYVCDEVANDVSRADGEHGGHLNHTLAGALGGVGEPGQAVGQQFRD